MIGRMVLVMLVAVVLTLAATVVIPNDTAALFAGFVIGGVVGAISHDWVLGDD